MKQRLLLLFAVLAMAFNVSAYDFEVDGMYYNTLSLQDLTCEVTYKSDNKYSGDIVIPSTVTYSGRIFSVTSIGFSAFRECTSLTSVTIPNSVTTIEYYAFYGCSLTSVTIPNSVTSIGSYAFYGCSSLTSVTIPNSVTEIGGAAFCYCSNLTSVQISNSVTSIASYAFYKCSSLSSVTIGNSVTTIGEYALWDCRSLREIKSWAVIPPTISYSTLEGVPKTEAVVKVPDESVDVYKAANYWKAFWNIVGINGEGGGGDEPETKQCAAPTIELVDGKLVVTSATEGATCYTSIKTDDYKVVTGNDPIELTGVYNITSYAYADGYENSETVTATLVWVNPMLEGTDILSMEAKKAVLISAQGSTIVVSGTAQGEGIHLYSIDGRLLSAVTAGDGQTIIPCSAAQGTVVIVKYGDKAVKLLIK